MLSVVIPKTSKTLRRRFPFAMCLSDFSQYSQSRLLTANRYRPYRCVLHWEQSADIRGTTFSEARMQPVLSYTGKQSINTSNVLSVIMGGGRGSRLFPLTKERAKPAVPLAGKYRLVDIPISNCINSGLRRIYLLTQFNSASLHRHISQSYKFDHFSGGFVEILAAEQTFSDATWYQGTADAVRKNLVHLLNHDFEYVLILSGDQLYRMDFRKVIRQHIETNAELTIATIPVHRREAEALGIMQIDRERKITRFVEKPKDPAVQDGLKIPRDMYDMLEITGDNEDLLLASMGIYVFNRDV